MRIPIHREGFPFIALFAGINLLAWLLASWLGWLLLPVTIWCIAFFRDPERNTPAAPGLVISPADGKLLPIVEAAPPPELGLGDAPRVRLSIFMNVFNVHVNRNPISGTVMTLAYRPGKFFNASFDKASLFNERMAIRVRPEGAGNADSDLAVVQIAGLVARRIVCDLAQGQGVQRGQRFGMIRFGSRLDVYLPPGARVMAQAGSKIVAGETILAQIELTMQADPERISRRARARAIVAARLEKLEELSIPKLVPSTLTLLGLCSGVTAIRYALMADWNSAVAAVVCAMIFDMLDGRAARLFGADSRFGAQLDSLADLVSFGVAPAIIVYTWSLEALDLRGWIAALVFVAASAVRLARFNVQAARDEGATNVHPYFTGLPTPAAAGMMLLPMLISFQWDGAVLRAPQIAIGIIAVTAIMMVSRLPTPSIKYMKLQRSHRVLALLFFAGLGALLIAWPWATLTVVLLIYVAWIPVALLSVRRPKPGL